MESLHCLCPGTSWPPEGFKLSRSKAKLIILISPGLPWCLAAVTSSSIQLKPIGFNLEVFPVPQILRCVNPPLLLLSPILSSPLYYPNSVPHCLSLELLQPPPGVAVTLAPVPEDPGSPTPPSGGPTFPLAQQHSSKTPTVCFLQERRRGSLLQVNCAFILGCLGRIPSLGLGAFPGVPTGYLLQRSDMKNYPHKRLRPWTMPESIKGLMSSWAISLCARTDLSQQECARRSPNRQYASVRVHACERSLQPLLAFLLLFKHLLITSLEYVFRQPSWKRIKAPNKRPRKSKPRFRNSSSGNINPAPLGISVWAAIPAWLIIWQLYVLLL